MQAVHGSVKIKTYLK